MRIVARLVIVGWALSCATWGQAPGPRRAAANHAGILDTSVDAKVEAILRKMTLEEKVGQLVQYSGGQPTGPGTNRSDYKDMLAKGQIGSLFNITTAKEVNAYQHIAVEKSRLHIPILFGLDVIHGFRTEFPIPLALASTWDPAIVEQASRIAAREASASGVRWTFSPMVDIARDARWGRMSEGSGEDPFLGSVMAAAYVRGYQGDRLNAADSIAACAKHFVGYGAAEAGRDYNTTEISEHTLRQYYLPPFRAAVDAGTASVMSAFNSLNGVPSSANPFTLKQVLRKEWGFRGTVVSDWGSIGELIPHGVAYDGRTAGRKGFVGGVDMDMESNLYHEHLAELVKSGTVTQAELDEAVRHVLRVKLALGLFEHPYTDESKEAGAMLRPEALEAARRAAERSFVLLRNAAGPNGAPLPIGSEVHKVALIGPLTEDPSMMLGAWNGKSRGEDVVSLRAALSQRLGESNVVQAKGTGFLGGSDQEIADAVTATQGADLVLLALGEQPFEMSGEAASRAALGVPGRQQELLEKVVASGKPVVLLLFSGRPLTVPWAFEHIPAVLAAWFPGVQAGPALVRTLFGESNPSGKLVVSWPRSVGQLPLYYNALSTGRPADKVDQSQPPTDTLSKFVSRYIDERNTPQFPFGYGLSYTTFGLSATEISAKELRAAQLNRGLDSGRSSPVLTASATLTNNGKTAGEEVVQLYVRLQGTSTAQPVRALKGFQRISLAPGETRKVTFSLEPGVLALWDDHNRLAVEPSHVTVWVSQDSASGTAASLEILP